MNRIYTGTMPAAMVGGRRDRRLEVAIENGRQRQTYYGALDIVKGTFLMQPYPKANAHHTVDFIRYLQQQRPDKSY